MKKQANKTKLSWLDLTERNVLIGNILHFFQCTSSGLKDYRARIVAVILTNGLPKFYLEDYYYRQTGTHEWERVEDQGDLDLDKYHDGASGPNLKEDGSVGFSVDIPEKGFLTGTIVFDNSSVN